MPANVPDVPNLWLLVDDNDNIQELFYDASNSKEQIGNWLHAYFSQLKYVGTEGMGYTPLYINGLIKASNAVFLGVLHGNTTAWDVAKEGCHPCAESHCMRCVLMPADGQVVPAQHRAASLGARACTHRKACPIRHEAGPVLTASQ